MRYSIPVMVIGLNLIPLSSEFSLLSPFALSITHILLNKSIMDEKNFQLSEEQEALLKGKFMLSVLFHFLFIYVLLLKTLYHYEIFAKERKLDEFNRQNRLIYKSNPWYVFTDADLMASITFIDMSIIIHTNDNTAGVSEYRRVQFTINAGCASTAIYREVWRL